MPAWLHRNKQRIETMNKLPTSYADAVMKDHPQAAKITDALWEYKTLIEESGIEQSLESYRAMADTAWASWVESQQGWFIGYTFRGVPR